MDKPIFVTQPSLPPLKDFIPYLEKIWNSRVLTNNGPFHEQLEDALCEYLNVPYISLFANGTLALIAAIKSLNLQGEIITTPYTFVATAHALLWSDVSPVFVDIDPVTLNLDPSKIEAAITPNTSAILPVHVYGHPCDAEAIESIAKQHKLRVIYDAAHAFGVRCHCGTILGHGDLSVLSFHATKVFNTFEGGAIVCHDLDTKKHIDLIKNFGFVNETSVSQIGINGKMNEFCAALGLVQLDHIDEQIEERRAIDEAYRSALNEIPGISCYDPPPPENRNYSYFPIFVTDQYPLSRNHLYERLQANNVNARRYFYPLVTDFSIYKGNGSATIHGLREAKRASERVICLPIYPELESGSIKQIINILIQGLSG